MAKPETPKPIRVPGPITRALAGRPQAEHARLKAQALHAALPDLPLVWEADGATIQVYRAEVMAGDLYLWVRAQYAGRPVALNLPLIYRNPPVCVHVGSSEDGAPVFQEAPLDGLKRIVENTVHRRVR